MYVCMCMYVCMYVCTYHRVAMYVYMYVCMYVCTRASHYGGVAAEAGGRRVSVGLAERSVMQNSEITDDSDMQTMPRVLTTAVRRCRRQRAACPREGGDNRVTRSSGGSMLLAKPNGKAKRWQYGASKIE